jgi:NADH-quinone oxidoreductase subunit M
MTGIFEDSWLLSLTVFLPLVGMVLMYFVPKAEEDLAKLIGLGTAVATMIASFVLMARFDFDRTDTLQFAANREWIDVINARYAIGLDGMSLPLVILSTVITVLVMIYSWNHIPNPGNAKGFYMLMLLLEVGMVGTFAAQDLILFFVFFELVLLPMYFMIGVWGGDNRQYASIKFFLYTAFGSALMLVAFLGLYWKTGGTTFVIPELTALVANGDIVRSTQLLIFGGMFIGFAIKVPMFPFHTWLPDAHTQAPTQGSVILAAVLLKLGTYGFIRIAIPILPEAAKEYAPWIGGLACVGIVYGAFGCLAQTDMKRLIAFSSVAHMGYVMLGIATLTDMGINAAIFGMVAHGLITGMLFFICGSIKDRYHTLEISRLGGILKQAPRLGWLYCMVSMASLGLPGLAGFWGEFPAIVSAYNPAPGLSVELFRVYMVIAAVGTVFAAAYLLWLLQRTMFGDPKPEFAGAHGGHGAHGAHGHDDHGAHGEDHEEIHDMNIYEYIAWTPLIISIIVLGVYPMLLFDITDGAVNFALTSAGLK